MSGAHPTGSGDVPTYVMVWGSVANPFLLLGKTMRVRKRDWRTGNRYAAHVGTCAGWCRTIWDGEMTHPLA
jgi:hypothetical protein